MGAWELELQATLQVRDLMWQIAFDGAKQGCQHDLMQNLGKHLAMCWPMDEASQCLCVGGPRLKKQVAQGLQDRFKPKYHGAGG